MPPLSQNTSTLEALTASLSNNNEIQLVSLIFTAVYGIPLVLGLIYTIRLYKLDRHSKCVQGCQKHSDTCKTYFHKKKILDLSRGSIADVEAAAE